MKNPFSQFSKKDELTVRDRQEQVDPYIRRVDTADKLSRRIISFGGYGIILVIVFILLFLIYQSAPLSFGASVKQLLSIPVEKTDHRIVLTGLDEYQEVAYTINDRGILYYYSLHANSDNNLKILKTDTLALQPGEKILSAAKGRLQGDYFAVGTDQGRILSAQIDFTVSYQADERIITPTFKPGIIFQAEDEADHSPAHVEKLTYSFSEDGDQYWAWVNHQNQLGLRIANEEDEPQYFGYLDFRNAQNMITSLVFNQSGDVLIIGFKQGNLTWFDVTDPQDVKLRDQWRGSTTAISNLTFLLGNEALVVADADGRVVVWFRVRTPDNIFKFSPIHSFESHSAAVIHVFPSPRNRSFLTVDARGGVHLNFSTTSRTQLEYIPSDHPIQTGAIAPKSDGILLIDTQNRFGWYRLENPYPAATIQTLFGKVWYENYPKPEFVWQSTGGSDEFESKYSLIPLIFGTVKGTIYAMIFSIPLAILAAIYVSQFAPRRLSRLVKPTIEIMAALPSVVIGFLAGLYFSPLFEKYLMSVLLITLLAPLVVFFGVFLWRFVPERFRMKAPLGWELIYMLTLMLLGFWLIVNISHPIENTFFGGSITQWLYNTLSLPYDTRNSLVVGFALGFAVIPIIFTVSEDALSNVPESLITASLALGASRWQTVRRIVIPAASGGIFAAIMLGFGRAIGETMIVLMATGNTPIIDLSPFNGFRAMSACIAVEIPEAPVGGTLYRILFLTALLLFVFTFLINTISAVIGDRLRKKYSRF